MFTVSKPHFLITIITTPEVVEHLVPNIRNFAILNFTKEELRGGTPGETGDKRLVKVQVLCSKVNLGGIMNYLIEHYIKRYGAVCYYGEVSVPL